MDDAANPYPGKSTAVSGFEAAGSSLHLAVFLHAFEGNARNMQGAIAALRKSANGPDTDTFAPDLPFGMFSRANPSEVLADLLAKLDLIWMSRVADGRAYETVTLVGHSMGSLFARKLYAAAMGQTSEAPFEAQLISELERLNVSPITVVRPWGSAITRIVLLAGMNRGWTISHHMSLTRGAAMSAGLWFSRAIEAVGARPFIVVAAHRGAPFVTQLRLQWLAMRERAARNQNALAQVVQLLGTQDDLVPPSDNVDPVTGSDFTYLEVPKSGHSSVVQMSEPGSIGEGRRRAFQLALTIPRGAATNLALAGLEPLEVDESLRHLVFVMHGIRDLGYWTEKIGSRIAGFARSESNSRVALETSSYGYFPLLSFLRPGARQEKVEWLMDRYTEAKARYPNASFSYVGHSHGTYLLWKAMKDYQAVRFERVVLAGSVLRTDQDWGPYFVQGRIGCLLNFVASGDWVVAFFPNAMQKLRWQDVGGAGHYGFSKATAGLVQLHPPKNLVAGGHSAALEEDWWDVIARFVVNGRFEQTDAMPLKTSHKWWVAGGALIAPLIWLLIAFALGAGLWLLLQTPWRESIKTLAVCGYFYLIWLILTRF